MLLFIHVSERSGCATRDGGSPTILPHTPPPQIPFQESQIALDEGDCFGVRKDEVTPTTDDAGLFDLIAQTPAILATFR